MGNDAGHTGKPGRLLKGTTMHEDASRLIPELPLWNNGKGISLGAWTSCIARYDHAIGYATLFWPDFVLYDDCVFLYEPDPEIYQEWMTGCKGDKSEVERVMNHRHITDMFINSEIEPTKEIIMHLGRLLKDMWQCRLQRDFPERCIKVELFDDGNDDLAQYQITVFQVRTRARNQAEAG
jgi:hypothetical protein